jgi:hypothetical protein
MAQRDQPLDSLFAGVPATLPARSILFLFFKILLVPILSTVTADASSGLD